MATTGRWRNLAEPTEKTQRAALWLKLRCEGLGPLELPLMAKVSPVLRTLRVRHTHFPDLYHSSCSQGAAFASSCYAP